MAETCKQIIDVPQLRAQRHSQQIHHEAENQVVTGECNKHLQLSKAHNSTLRNGSLSLLMAEWKLWVTAAAQQHECGALQLYGPEAHQY